MGSLDDVVASLLPVKIETPSMGVLLFEIPTVRQAVLMHGLLPFWEDPDCAERLRDVLEEWLPKGTSVVLSMVDWETQAYVINTALHTWSLDNVRVAKDGEIHMWTRGDDLSLVLAEYRHWINPGVLDEPWPFFLVQARKLDALKAEVGLANLGWYTATRDKKQWDSLMERSGFERVKPSSIDPIAEDDEHIQGQVENARGIARIMMMHAKR